MKLRNDLEYGESPLRAAFKEWWRQQGITSDIQTHQHLIVPRRENETDTEWLERVRKLQKEIDAFVNR